MPTRHIKLYNCMTKLLHIFLVGKFSLEFEEDTKKVFLEDPADQDISNKISKKHTKKAIIDTEGSALRLL